MLDQLINFRDSSFVFSILKNSGGESRFVGGCVRNAMMGLDVSDIDIATTLLPDQVERVFQAHNIRTINIGKEHGTIIAVINAHSYEITTLRKDLSTDGRRAVVSFSNDWKEDAERRDFTINAMSYCPLKKKLYDYFGGVKDLKNKLIKFVGFPEDRVKEDYLRILRLFRFYTYYGKSIEARSLSACIRYAEGLQKISGERQYSELKKILSHVNSEKSLEIMIREKILFHVFGQDVSIESISYLNRLSEFEYQPEYIFLFKFFVLMIKGNISVKDVVPVLKIPNKDKRYLDEVCKLSSLDIAEIRENLYKFIYRNIYIYDAILFLVLYNKIDDLSILEEIKKYRSSHLSFPINGDEIKKLFKIKEGKAVGAKLDLALDYWCKNQYVPTKKEILFYLQKGRIV